MRISDWSSDVCSSDLPGTSDRRTPVRWRPAQRQGPREGRHSTCGSSLQTPYVWIFQSQEQNGKSDRPIQATPATTPRTAARASQSYRISTILTITGDWSQDTQNEARRRSEEHTYELKSLMRH